MAVTRSEAQVEWSAADTISVTSGGNQTSDAFTIPDDAFSGRLQGKADNAGTPAAGDTLDVYIVYTLGDPDVDPDSADEYDVGDTTHAIFLGRLNTNVVDPALASFPIDVAAKGGKIHVRSNAASNSITASFQLNFKKA